MQEAQIINGCRKGERSAQRCLYEKYKGRLFGICLRYCNSREEAEDVLQEGLLKIYQKIENFKGEGSLEGWMKRIMVNTALDNYRKSKHRDAETEWQDHYNLPTEALTDMKAKDLLTVINRLPTGFRTVFNLYAIEGYNHPEIGRLLGISEGTSKSQYARARASIIKMLAIEETALKTTDGTMPIVL